MRSTHRQPYYTVLSDAGRNKQRQAFHDIAALRTGHYRSVLHELDLDSEGLTDRMCPVQLAGGECVILVLGEFVQDDGVLALQIAMQQAGLRMAACPLVVVTPSRLSEVVRKGRVDKRTDPGRNGVLATPGHVLLCVLDDMLAWALCHGASDLHLGVFEGSRYAYVAFTVRATVVRPEQFQSITSEVMQELLGVVWMRVQGGNGAVFEPDREQQGRLERTVTGRKVIMRWASIASQRGPCVTLRLLQRDISDSAKDLAGLGYSPSQLDSFYRARLATGGAVLLSGAVGSGKSTTLAALVRSLPPERKIITLEDPVEFDLPNAIQCAITEFGQGQEDDGRFDLKLRAIKRSAANDVLIGEIRDAGSARALSDLLVAGANVYSTVHAGSALQIVDRLRSPLLGVAVDLLAVPGVLKLLGYQVLLNRLCQSCCHTPSRWLTASTRVCALGLPISADLASKWLARFERLLGADIQAVRFRNLQGCSRCNTTGSPHDCGFDGHLMAAELLEPQRIEGFDQWLNQTGCAIAGARPRLTYESARDVALGYVSRGLLDPREFEMRLGGV